MTRASEVELKLRLPRAALAALRRHPALRAAVRGRARRESLAATYYDTPDLALARRGIALRVRRERGRWVQALKAGGAAAGGLAERSEDEWSLGRGTRRPSPDLSLLATTPVGRAAARAVRRVAPGPVFVTTIERTSLPLAFGDGTTAVAAIDVGRVRAASGRRASAAICELELELREGDVARLFELALALCADLPLAVEPRSKAQRGYALAATAPDGPRHAQAPEYARDADAGAAIAAILVSALAQVEGNAGGAATSDDPEWVHQLRVGLRRLRAALGLARALVDADALRAIVDEARRIADALGRARDLDVFADETLPPLAAAAGASADAVAALAAEVRRHRVQARAEVRAVLRSAPFQRLLLNVGALAASLAARPGAAAVRSFAQDALRRRHKQLLRAGEALDGGTPEERHRVRIAAKKLRYAAEFLATPFPSRRAEAYRSALAGVQEVLGRINDAATATAIAADVSGKGTPGAALVAGWAAAHAAGEEREMRRAWQRFRAAKPFWKDTGGR
ncbi:MAG: CYTH and CHAD domain-containing protein [Betaproteobacteria bacterium]|nr:CYTH and CHAD domain-containing protein [Betaproteobacteria bacterium]MDH5286025.1 CYTH and CHAD domain-containing protein [Betaproteobacteria bacterium]